MSFRNTEDYFKAGILLVVFLCFLLPVIGQTDSISRDTISADTVSSDSKQLNKKIRSSRSQTNEWADTIIILAVDTSKGYTSHKNPRVAALSSAIIPGLGQAYNGKYFKIPVIYGTGTLLYYYFDRYNYSYHRLKDARKELKDTGTITDPELKTMSDASLELNMNNFRRNRDYQIIFMGLLYVANIVDAMVDAHMYEFDVSKDLTMKISPSFEPLPNDTYTASAGLKFSFRF